MDHGKRKNDRESRVYPLISIVCSILILVGGLILAPHNGWIYILACLVMLLAFGMWKGLLKVAPFIALFGLLYFLLSYLLTHDVDNAVAGVVRIAALFVAIVPSFYLHPEDLIRSLNQIHFPRSASLGLLIVLRFFPMLAQERRRIKEAIKTRSMPFSIKGVYRANVVPFVSRLVHLSDALSLSIETKGFKKEKEGSTVYRYVSFYWIDAAFFLLTLSIFVLSLIFLPGVTLWAPLH